MSYDGMFAQLVAQRDEYVRVGKDPSDWFPAANELLAVSNDIPRYRQMVAGATDDELRAGLEGKLAELEARAEELIPIVLRFEQDLH